MKQVAASVWLLWVLCIGFSSQVFAQNNFSVGPEPAWVVPAAYDPLASAANPDEAGYAYFILLDKQHQLEEETTYRHLVFRILNEKGLQEYADISVEYDPSFQSLRFHKIEVIRQGARLNKLHRPDFKIIQRESGADAHLYDGRLTALVHLKDIRIGDVVSYSYSIRGRNPIYQGRFFEDNIWQYGQEMEKISLRLLHKPGRKLQLKEMGQTPRPLVRSTSAGMQEYVWVQEKASPLVFDSQAPSWFNPTPQTQISELPDWGAVVALMLPAYQLTQAVPDKSWQELQKALFLPSDLQEDKIRKLVHFVQNDIRYLGLENGISAYKPHPPAQVLAQKFGDCKDKALLLCSLLEKLGVEAYPALVNTYLMGEVKNHLPSPDIFNHCIVSMQYQDSTYWFDATYNGQGGSLKTMSLPHYKQALLIKKGETNLTAVKDYPLDKRVVREYYKLGKEQAPTELTIMSRYKGYEAENQRTYFSNSNIRDVEKGYLNFYAGLYPGIALKKELKFRDREASFETEENYQIDSLWEKKPEDAVYHYASFYPLYLNDYLQVPEKKIRQMPFQLNYPLQITEELIIELPEFWQIKEEKKEITNEFFSFGYEVAYQHPVVTIRYQYQLHKSFVPAEKTAAYIKDISRAKDMLGYELSYAEEGALAHSLSYPMLAGVLTFLLLFTIGCVQVYKKYNPAPKALETYYHSIGGWLFLPMLGLMITPLMVLSGTISWDYFDGNVLHPLFDATSPYFMPLKGSILVVECLFNLALVIGCVFLLILLFERRTSFPSLMCLYLLLNFSFILMELLVLHGAGLAAGSDLSSSYADLGRSFIGCCIWIPYLMVSERVKHTFTHVRRSVYTYTAPIEKSSIEEKPFSSEEQPG